MEHTLATHTVFNQTPPLTEYNLFTTDRALQEAVQREGAGAAVPELADAGGRLCPSGYLSGFSTSPHRRSTNTSR